jgi:DNA polymerase I-like protein with 3'-5' exonuclease and polymerase domains
MLPSQLPEVEGYVAVDTETSGLFPDDGARVSVVSVAWCDPDDKTRINSYAWPFDQGLVPGKAEYHGQDALWADAENLPEEEWVALLGWLRAHQLVMHNAKFDLGMLRVGTRTMEGTDLQEQVVWDTQNVNNLIYPLHPTSLKPTAQRLWGADQADEAALVKAYLKKAKLPPGRWDLVPWDVIGSYAAKDAELTIRLYERQFDEIDHMENSEQMFEFVERRLQTMLTLYRMEWRGVPYHEVESRLAADLCRERATEIAGELPFTPTGPKAKKFFFGEGVSDRGVTCLNMVPYQLTDKGEPSLTAEVLERMVADAIPHARAYYEWTKVDNAASMWYEGYAEKMGTDGRLRCSFRQNGTVSSRFSVERINLQAIPQDYRLTGYDILRGIPTPRQLIAQAVDLMEGGWRLFELDLAQAELRVAAVFADCRSMLDLIFAGADLHTVTTRELFDMDTDHPEWGKYRQVGKRGNFSLIFGAQWLTFQKMVSKETGIVLPDHEAQRIVLEWNRLYPEFGRAVAKHANKVAVRQARHGHGWIDLRNGEKRWFQKYEETHKSFNQRVQPNLAQFGIDWMLQTDEFLRKEGYGEWNQAGLVLTIHDSQVLLLPDNKEGEQLAEACAQFGRDLWGKWFPEVPGEVDYHPWEVAA